jgi:hypothetical protein
VKNHLLNWSFNARVKPALFEQRRPDATQESRIETATPEILLDSAMVALDERTAT